MRNATRITTGVMGTLMALAGLEHGIGEVLQGNKATEGLVIQSWPGSAFFENLGGEPALTVVPNLLASGILTILFSLIALAWAVRFVQRKHGGLGLILLSIAMFPVGGGFGPALLGILLGAAATRIDKPFPWMRLPLTGALQHSLAALWKWSLGACVAAWLALCPGSSALAYFFGLNDQALVMGLIFASFGLLLVTIGLGYVHDSLPQAKAYPITLKFKRKLA